MTRAMRFLRGTALSIAALLTTVDATNAQGADSVALAERAISTYQSAQSTDDASARVERFRTAHRLYEQLRTNLVENSRAPTAELEVNLANAAYQAKRLGAAVLGYRRALVIDPDHPRALRNLREVRRELASRDVPVPAESTESSVVLSWIASAGPTEWRLLAATLFGVGLVGIAIGIVTRSTIPRNLGVLLLFGWVTTLVYSNFRPTPTDAAVITTPLAEGRQSDSVHAVRSFDLVGGTEVRLVEKRQDWVRVELPDRSTTWVSRTAVTPVTPE